ELTSVFNMKANPPPEVSGCLPFLGGYGRIEVVLLGPFLQVCYRRTRSVDAVFINEDLNPFQALVLPFAEDVRQFLEREGLFLARDLVKPLLVPAGPPEHHNLQGLVGPGRTGRCPVLAGLRVGAGTVPLALAAGTARTWTTGAADAGAAGTKHQQPDDPA